MFWGFASRNGSFANASLASPESLNVCNWAEIANAAMLIRIQTPARTRAQRRIRRPNRRGARGAPGSRQASAGAGVPGCCRSPCPAPESLRSLVFDPPGRPAPPRRKRRLKMPGRERYTRYSGRPPPSRSPFRGASLRLLGSFAFITGALGRRCYFRTNTLDPACCAWRDCTASFEMGELARIASALVVLSTAMDSTRTIGADVGGTKLLVGVLDESMEVSDERLARTTGLRSDQLIELLEDSFRDMINSQPDVAAIGLGVPATIDRRKGLAIGAVNLDIVDVPIRDELQERLDLPVSIDNDGNLAALAEQHYGAGRGARNVVMLTIGTGIGGGLILDGEIYRGRNGAGAELGHTVIEADGPPCQGNCPGRGCVETLASGTALGREGRIAAEREPDSALGRMATAGRQITGVEVTEAALAGDPTARDVVQLIGHRLGIAMTTFANIFEPDVIVVGGGVMAAGELLLEPAREQIVRHALPPMNKTPVVAAELGPRAGMIGAAALARIELEEGN